MTAIQKKRYGIKDMQEVHPIPHLDLPDLHEIACLRPKDGAPYLMFLCEEAKPYVGTCPTCGAASVQKHGTLKKDRFIHDVSR